MATTVVKNVTRLAMHVKYQNVRKVIKNVHLQQVAILGAVHLQILAEQPKDNAAKVENVVQMEKSHTV